jgi:prefoldin subunit 5
MLKLNQRTKTYAIGAILGLAAGGLFYLLQPTRWDGEALVGVGHTSQVKQDQFGQAVLIEDVSTALERLKSFSFVRSVAKRANSDQVGALLNADVGGGLSVKQNRNANSMLIIVRGSSAELVRTAVDAVVAELLSKHAEILSEYQADTRQELSKLETEIDRLSKRVARVSNVRTGASTGFELALLQHDLELNISRASALRESISSKNMRPTTLLEPVAISERKMLASPWRACALGALLGILFSVIWIRWKGIH